MRRTSLVTAVLAIAVAAAATAADRGRDACRGS